MPRKVIDISLIEENKSDLTFFNIEEEESNETLKALKQSYVTTNYKDETILNLQKTLNSNSEDTSRELKIESYKKYNNALDLSQKDYITSAYYMIEEAISINPKDVDILNLKGLLALLKCDFSNSFESFYTAMCYGNNELSRKYVDILSGDEFKVFLGRYNHSIRFINEELNYESIHILDNIIEEDSDLIEPYVILSLLYDKLGNIPKREMYLQKLREIDKDNYLFEEKDKTHEDEDKQIVSKNPKKLNLIVGILAGCLLLSGVAYSTNSKNKIEELNSQLTKKDEKLNQLNNKLDEKNQNIKEKTEELDKVKNENKENITKIELVVTDEATLYSEAIKLKKDKDYKEAINKFKEITKNGKTKKYISESVYEVALLSEKLENNEDAISYYKKYINTYTPNEQYYDDAFYQLGMLYYKIGDLEKAKNTFYGLKSEVPDSMYNNSKVTGILKEK